MLITETILIFRWFSFQNLASPKCPLVTNPSWWFRVCMHVQLLNCVRVFSDPMNCSSPGSSVHRILQARILEWVAISFSRESSRPRDRTPVSASCIAGGFFTIWASGEGPMKMTCFPHNLFRGWRVKRINTAVRSWKPRRQSGIPFESLLSRGWPLWWHHELCIQHGFLASAGGFLGSLMGVMTKGVPRERGRKDAAGSSLP